MSQLSTYNLIVILGPTASGKTSVASHLAVRLNSEVISADSRQVYRDLNLGTGKDYADYIVEGKHIPVHLMDIQPAGYQYNLYEYQRDFLKVFEQLRQRQVLPILCGGTGLYIEAVLKGYHLVRVPVNEPLRKQLEGKDIQELNMILSGYHRLHNVSDADTVKRAVRAIEIAEYQKDHPLNASPYPDIHPLIIGVRYPREVERERITQRLQQRLDQGMIQEVEDLLNSGITPEQLIYYGLEYKFLTQYLTGSISYDTMFGLLNTAIHQFAKRQMTWFRKMEREGTPIHWLEGALPMDQKLELIQGWLVPPKS